MSLLRYEKYKDSGVEWLGEVPSGWGIKRVKHLFEVKKRISGDEGYEVLSITQQGIKVKDIESGDGQLSMDYSKYQFVEVGDFAMNHMDLLTGYVDISSIFGVTSPDYRVFSIRDKEVCFDRYYLYLFQMGYRNKIFYAFGQGSSQLGRWRFPTEQFNSFEFPSPPIQEQISIAAFLDRETVKIDALITEQQRLIALLAEKRQAIISHAVTKGLNPDVPMKDSGIEWMGEVPEHWQVKRLKHIKALTPNAFVDGPFGSNLKGEHFIDDGDVYVIESNFATQGKLDLTELKTISFEHFSSIQRSETKSGDIIIAKIGALFGRASILPRIDKKAVVSGNSLKLTVNDDICSTQWAYWQLFNLKACGEIDLLVNGSAQPALSLGAMNNLVFLLPSLKEQSTVIAFLEREIAKLDTLTTEAQRAIILLQERRTALISEAVTGKIDVRGLSERDAA